MKQSNSALYHMLCRVAQSVARLIQEPEVPGSIPGPSSYSADLKRAVMCTNRVGGISLPRESVTRLTDRSDMAKAYRGPKTTTQQHQSVQYVNLPEISDI